MHAFILLAACHWSCQQPNILNFHTEVRAPESQGFWSVSRLQQKCPSVCWGAWAAEKPKNFFTLNIYSQSKHQDRNLCSRTRTFPPGLYPHLACSYPRSHLLADHPPSPTVLDSRDPGRADSGRVSVSTPPPPALRPRVRAGLSSLWAWQIFTRWHHGS